MEDKLAAPTLIMESPLQEQLLARDRAAFHRTAVFIGLSVIVSSLMGMFSAEKLGFLFKDVLHLSASGMATLGLVMGIPAYLRPFMGAGSDLYPLFGYRRRSYFALAWALVGLGFLALACLPTTSYHYGLMLALGLLTGAGGALAFVALDAVMVAVGNRSGTIGQLQTIQQFLPFVLGITFAAHYGGYVTQHWSYQHCFLGAALSALAAMPLALLIQEERIRPAGSQGSGEMAGSPQHAHDEDHAEHTAALRKALRTPGLWAMVAFVFYLIITPGTNTAQFYYSVDVLHFSKQFLGDLGRWGSAGAMLGIITFAVAARRLPVRSLVWGAYLMDCSLYLASMALHNQSSALAVSFATSFLGSVYNLCLLTLAARACPPGVEGAVYGLVISATFLAGALGEKMGSFLYDYFGPAHHFTTAHGWHSLLWVGLAFTVIAAGFIPFLPGWTRSSEPIRARTV